MKRTRECTPVLYAAPATVAELSFAQISYKVMESLPIKPFKSKTAVRNEDIDCMLEKKLAELNLLKEQARFETMVPSRRKEACWRDKVNRKRRLIASCINRQANLNLREICRYTGSSFAMVKNVHLDLLHRRQWQQFEYPNRKHQSEVTELLRTISQVDGSYSTISDLKQRHPNFSRKWIAKTLRGTGHRWRLMLKKRKTPKSSGYSPKEVIKVVGHLAQSIVNEHVEVLYIDEVHFPLVQTSTHHWTTLNPDKEQLVYNRRPVEETKLSVIAVCTLKSFVAVQIFKRDITADDFLYFLQEVLKLYGREKKVTVLADNATWHKTDSIAKSKAGKFLYFNVKGLFQSNAIENCFSFVRAEFRKRPLVGSLEEEALLLGKIFFSSDNVKRFEGIARNHLRSLRMLLKREVAADQGEGEMENRLG